MIEDMKSGLRRVDELGMSISGVSCSGCNAMAAGMRSEIHARTMRQVLDAAGLLEPDLAVALQSIEATSHSLVTAGVTLAGNQLLGSLFDALA